MSQSSLLLCGELPERTETNFMKLKPMNQGALSILNKVRQSALRVKKWILVNTGWGLSKVAKKIEWTLSGKNGLEVGGPSEIFSYSLPVYFHIKSVMILASHALETYS